MLVFTEHAIERFITRIAPELTRAEALAYLQAEAPSAAKMREKTAVGSTMWRLGDVVAISKRDPGKPDDVVVTIVPSRYADIREGVPSHEIAMALERIEARDEWPPLTVPMPAGPKPTTTRPVAAAQVVAVKPVKRPLHKHPPRASDVDVLLHIVELEGGLQRQREKTMRHLATFDAQLSKLRHALRIAVRRLRANGDEETLASIRALDSGLAGDDFADMDALRALEAGR